MSLLATNPQPARSSAFDNTRWSMVLRAADAASGEGDAALESLCRIYWQPLYGYIRRRGYSVEDAQDLTQGFFARLLDKRYLSGIDRRKGKFRSFLLAALENFIANQRRDAQAQKRGGGVSFISFDADLNEAAIAVTAQDAITYFEQQWAITLLNEVLARLQSEFTASGRAALYEDIKDALTGQDYSIGYSDVAAKHGTTEASIKMTVYRLRNRYRELLIEELSNTVSSEEEIEDELRALFAALA